MGGGGHCCTAADIVGDSEAFYALATEKMDAKMAADKKERLRVPPARAPTSWCRV